MKAKSESLGEKQVMYPESMKSFAITMATAFGILLGVVPIASAENTQCTGIDDGTTINGNLTVPANAHLRTGQCDGDRQCAGRKGC
jgi:hypothetical protein